MTSTEVIEEIGTRLAKVTPPRSRVLLFGSHARGTADDGSDFDVLVIEPAVESPVSEAVRLRRELRGLGVPIDVVVMDEEGESPRDRARNHGRACLARGAACLSRPERVDLAKVLLRKAEADLDPHDDLHEVLDRNAATAAASSAIEWARLLLP